MKWPIRSGARCSHREEQTSHRPSGGQSSAAARAPSAVLLEPGCPGGPRAGGCTAAAIPGCPDVSPVVPQPVYFSHAIIHIERNQRAAEQSTGGSNQWNYSEGSR